MLEIKTQHVFDDLKAVIVEIADDFGCISKDNDCYDQESKQHVQQDNYLTMPLIVKL